MNKLLAWRAIHERRFVYNPSPTQQDIQELARFKTEYDAKAATIAWQMVGGQAEMVQLVNMLRQRLAAENTDLGKMAIRRTQLEVDLAFLGISKPSKGLPPGAAARRAPRYGPRLAAPSRAVYHTPSMSGVSCPQCGAVMVSRTARRGPRRGKSFWDARGIRCVAGLCN